jgi:hypothetical protein
MPSKLIVDLDTGVETVVEMNEEEVAVLEAIREESIAQEAVRQAHEELKVSAKAKLVAGEPLTEEEAATIVL